MGECPWCARRKGHNVCCPNSPKNNETTDLARLEAERDEAVAQSHQFDDELAHAHFMSAGWRRLAKKCVARVALARHDTRSAAVREAAAKVSEVVEEIRAAVTRFGDRDDPMHALALGAQLHAAEDCRDRILALIAGGE